MKNIILPEFYFQSNLNQKISYLIDKFPEYFSMEIKIDSEEGSFPFTFWNGQGNNNIYPINLPSFANYQLVSDSLNKVNRIGLDLTNQYLTKKDILNNSELNTILKILENGSNYLILNNLEFKDILKEKYPLYYHVYQASAYKNSEIDEDIYRIKIPYFLLENYLYLNKNKIEVVFPIKCLMNCDYFKQEQLSQFMFSEKSFCLNCTNNVKTNFYFEIEKLSKKGFQYFSFNAQGISKNNAELFQKIFCDTFIKKEYYFQVLYFLEKDNEY